MNNEPALRLADGRVFKMPSTPELSEFRLSGNWRLYPQSEMACFYDETTSTGASLFTAGAGFWVIQQPITRENYWLHCELLAGATNNEKAKVAGVMH